MRKIFRKEYKYKRKFVNACILRIRCGNINQRTITGYKTYIFKAMRTIVEKNIANYLQLLNGSPCRELPEYNEVLSECYLVFDKCIEKYKITKTNSFYFYFNKALSRYFYKLYQKEVNMPVSELSDEMATVLPTLVDKKNNYSVNLIMTNLNIHGLERRICISRLRGEKGTKFLRKNKRVTQKEYNQALTNVRELLKQLLAEVKY